MRKRRKTVRAKMRELERALDKFEILRSPIVRRHQAKQLLRRVKWMTMPP